MVVDPLFQFNLISYIPKREGTSSLAFIKPHKQIPILHSEAILTNSIYLPPSPN
ncbi:hypothetical protein NTGM5_100005 [Candidatus Nitrotoga sp. M5]|nr:hypothetical protein NTGM5_100005 [Candidatus Nitrotoga sp. M5]